MKQTLRDKILNLLLDTRARRNQLEDYINEYKQAGDYESAMKCDIKRKQFDLFIAGLNEVLEK